MAAIASTLSPRLIVECAEYRLVALVDTLPIVKLPGHLSVGARWGWRHREHREEGRTMDPVTTAAVVVVVISSAGTVLAAWVQGRAQRPAGGGQQVTNRPAQCRRGRPAR